MPLERQRIAAEPLHGEDRVGQAARRRERFAGDAERAQVEAGAAELRRDEQPAETERRALAESLASGVVDLTGFPRAAIGSSAREVLEPRLQRSVPVVEKREIDHVIMERAHLRDLNAS